MPKVFQTFKTKLNPEGGRVQVLDAKGRPIPHPFWRAVILEWTGKRKTVTLAKSRVESQRIADALQAEQTAIRQGRIEPPNPVKRAAMRPYGEVVAEYQAWGETQGGRGGRPWSKANAEKRRYYLKWWGEALAAKTLADLDNALPRAEKALQGLAAKNRSGKTLSAYREGLFAFCLWCRKRRYLPENPFEHMSKFDTTPRKIRRAMNPVEIRDLLSVCPTYRAVLYETAFSCGFRASEMRSLDTDALDRERGGLRLSAEVDKGRRERFQPLPADLVRRLADFADSGEAVDLYRRQFARAGQPVPSDLPTQPLLYVPKHPARTIRDDLTAAGIPITTPAGYLDFHACRTAYINLVIDTGADLKTAQTLSRHTTPNLTMNVYGRSKDARLAAVAEAVGRMIHDAQPMPPESVKQDAVLTRHAVSRVKTASTGGQGGRYSPPGGSMIENPGDYSQPNRTATEPAEAATSNKNATAYEIGDCVENTMVHQKSVKYKPTLLSYQFYIALSKV